MSTETQTMTQAPPQSQQETLRNQRSDHCKYIPDEFRTDNDAATPSANDPFDLERYVSNQKTTFRTAINEIKNGKKETHWMWFVLPTSPYIVNGVEQGSRTNRYFCLRSDDEVVAYLQFESKGVNLQKNYIAIVTELKNQLKKGKTLEKLLPPKDVPKAISSLCLFQRVAQENSFPEVFQVCSDVLKLVEKRRQNFSLFQKIRNKILKNEKNSSSTKLISARKSQTMH